MPTKLNEHIPMWNVNTRCTQIKTYCWDNAQVVLVGNKVDMEADRLVSKEKAKRLADQLGNHMASLAPQSKTIDTDMHTHNMGK